MGYTKSPTKSLLNYLRPNKSLSD